MLWFVDSSIEWFTESSVNRWWFVGALNLQNIDSWLPSLNGSLIQQFGESLTHWVPRSVIYWFIESLFPCFIGSLIRWLTDSLVRWLTASLVHWFINAWFIGPFTQLCVYSFISFHWHLNNHFSHSLLHLTISTLPSLPLHRKNFPTGHWCPTVASLFRNFCPGGTHKQTNNTCMCACVRVCVCVRVRVCVRAYQKELF